MSDSSYNLSYKPFGPSIHLSSLFLPYSPHPLGSPHLLWFLFCFPFCVSSSTHLSFLCSSSLSVGQTMALCWWIWAQRTAPRCCTLSCWRARSCYTRSGRLCSLEWLKLWWLWVGSTVQVSNSLLLNNTVLLPATLNFNFNKLNSIGLIQLSFFLKP